jgi:hypothetical protein
MTVRSARKQAGTNSTNKSSEGAGENSNREAIELVQEFIQRIDAIPNVDRTKPMQLEMAGNSAALRGKPDELPTAMSVVAGAGFVPPKALPLEKSILPAAKPHRSVTGMKQHLTERAIKAMVPDIDRDVFVYDDEAIGFAICVYRSGKRAFVLRYRIAGRARHFTIGSWPDWSVTAAREERSGSSVKWTPATIRSATASITAMRRRCPV